MSLIQVEDSDFMSKTTQVRFSDGVLYYRLTAVSPTERPIEASEIKSLNRIRATKISGTNTNIFMNHFLGGTFFAIIMEFLGFKAGAKKLDRRIHIHFKDGKFISGMTDTDTFFDVQNAWLDSKSDDKIEK